MVITGLYTLMFLITNDLLKWYLKAKLTGSKTIVINLNPNGTLEFTGLVRKNGIMYDGKGNIVQDYERLKERNTEKGELRSLAYNYGSIRFLFLNDGELAGLNKQGKPASLDMPYFNRLRNLEKIRLEKRNKLIKHKAMPFSFIMLIVIAIIAIIGILALKEFVIPMISNFI